MSQYPYTGPYSTQNPQNLQNQPSSYNTGTGLGTGTTGTGLGTGTGLSTGLGTGQGYTTSGSGLGTGTGYIQSTTGQQGMGVTQQPIVKRKHRPESRSSSSSSSDKEGTKKKGGLGQKIKGMTTKVKEMLPGHHQSTNTTNPQNFPS